MDKKDERIIEVLKENSKLSSQQISKKTGIPITTVHNRIKKLVSEGIIRNYTINLDYKRIGKPLSAYVLITVDYRLLREIKRTQHELTIKLKRHPYVEEATMVTGGTDILIKARVKDMDELNKLVTGYVRDQEGVDRTQTLVVLEEA